MAASSQCTVYFPSFSHQAILFPHFDFMWQKRLFKTISWSWSCWRLSVRVGCVAGGPPDPEVTFSQWALTADDSLEGRSGMDSLKKGNWNITGSSNLTVSVRFFLRLDGSSEQSFKNACLKKKKKKMHVFCPSKNLLYKVSI